MLADFRLSSWLVTDIDFFLGLLNAVAEGDADVSKVACSSSWSMHVGE
jgi:hypothetical protein